MTFESTQLALRLHVSKERKHTKKESEKEPPEKPMRQDRFDCVHVAEL